MYQNMQNWSISFLVIDILYIYIYIYNIKITNKEKNKKNNQPI